MNNQSFFKDVKTIAIVGLSDKPERDSFKVAKYLQEQGFRIIPVNPTIAEVLGEKAYPDLSAIPKDIAIDVVDLFRRSDQVVPSVKEAIIRGDAHTIWMQEGVENEEAASLARGHGLNVVMNFCLMKAHQSHI